MLLRMTHFLIGHEVITLTGNDFQHLCTVHGVKNLASVTDRTFS